MTDDHASDALASPMIDASSEAFYAAAAEDRFLGRVCTHCERLHWYPRPVCPYCMGATEWITLGGHGEVYSVTVSRRGRRQPFALAYVRLDAGVTVMTNIVDDELERIHIGDRVEVVFTSAADSGVMPAFRLAKEAR